MLLKFLTVTVSLTVKAPRTCAAPLSSSICCFLSNVILSISRSDSWCCNSYVDTWQYGLVADVVCY